MRQHAGETGDAQDGAICAVQKIRDAGGPIDIRPALEGVISKGDAVASLFQGCDDVQGAERRHRQRLASREIDNREIRHVDLRDLAGNRAV